MDFFELYSIQQKINVSKKESGVSSKHFESKRIINMKHDRRAVGLTETMSSVKSVDMRYTSNKDASNLEVSMEKNVKNVKKDKEDSEPFSLHSNLDINLTNPTRNETYGEDGKESLSFTLKKICTYKSLIVSDFFVKHIFTAKDKKPDQKLNFTVIEHQDDSYADHNTPFFQSETWPLEPHGHSNQGFTKTFENRKPQLSEEDKRENLFSSEIIYHESLKTILNNKKFEIPMVDFLKSKLPSRTNIPCFGCRRIYTSYPLGVPVEYYPGKRKNKRKYSVIQGRELEDSDRTETEAEKEHFVTDGLVCSFNCMLNVIKDSHNKIIFQQSNQLIYKLYEKIFGKIPSEKIIPAPSFRIRKEYGGDVSDKDFEKMLQTVEFIELEHLIMRPCIKIFENKKNVVSEIKIHG